VTRRDCVPAFVSQAACLVLALLPGCDRHQPDTADAAGGKEARAAARAVLEVMRDRLLLMEDVARWKWNAGKLEADAKREEALVADMVAKAPENGLDGDWVKALFLAQIDAAKRVQQDRFRRWKAEARGKFDGVPDLHAGLRPKIDRLNVRLLEAAGKARLHARHPWWRGFVEEESIWVLSADTIGTDVRSAAVAPLLRLEP